MRTKASDQIEIRIPRRAEFVRVARSAALAVASQMDFTYDIIKDIELVTGEACANAVEHVADESCQDVLVRFSLCDESLTIEVIDRGQGFDAECVRRLEAGGDWDDPRGFGLLVIRQLMDEVTIECDPVTGTCVRMVKRKSG
ncbi:MAG: ATP-binding protein [Armatimonadota bacterium]